MPSNNQNNTHTQETKTEGALQKQRFTKQERSWILYDWANSVYATVMMAALCPIYFSSVAESAGQPGDYWWGIGTSVAMIFVAVLSPIIGAFADYLGWKKRIFCGFLGCGLIFTAICVFTNSWSLLLIGYAVSHIGFAGANLVYDSFLPDITVEDNMDRVSSYGYAMGYIGGSTIPFILCIGFIMLSTFRPDIMAEAIAYKISLGITVIWWAVFSIPFLRNVHQQYGLEQPKKNLVRETFRSVGNTARKIVHEKGLLVFILAYFFYIDGVNTVISMSTAYGSVLGLNTVLMIVALLVTQIIAMPCSIAFGNLSKKIGSLPLIFYAVGTYLVICVLGFIMGFGLEENLFDIPTAQIFFWVLASLVGTVQGGIQAISRSYFSKQVPPQNAGEFFGFFEIFGRFAAVMGPLLYSFTKGITGRSSFSILSIIVLFLLALIILIGGRKHLAK